MGIGGSMRIVLVECVPNPKMDTGNYLIRLTPQQYGSEFDKNDMGARGYNDKEIGFNEMAYTSRMREL